MMEVYPEIKAKIISLSEVDQSERETLIWKEHSKAIQQLSLQYLRYHFLKDESLEALKECHFLLGKLMEHKSVDLDVLVDTYVKIESELDNSTKEKYLDHIATEYFKDQSYLQKNVQLMKDKYMNAEDPLKKERYLAEVKHMEKLSECMQYVNDLLSIEQNYKSN